MDSSHEAVSARFWQQSAASRWIVSIGLTLVLRQAVRLLPKCALVAALAVASVAPPDHEKNHVCRLRLKAHHQVMPRLITAPAIIEPTHHQAHGHFHPATGSSHFQQGTYGL
jgi:hypothetical protein